MTTRRQVCSAAALALVGTSGCLGGLRGGSPTLDGDLADWEWSGTLPVDSVVQHHHPFCECCSEYVTYLEAHGIGVEVVEIESPPAVKGEFGVPEAVRSCHTVEFGDYLVEGHVPLEAVERLFEEDSSVDGIAAPEMPDHSPGMGPRGDEPLAIYGFTASGEVDEFLEI
ncbi:DUF411 domain-containing protein [Natrarchaeobius chitinivorans]|uniref:Metal-binding protein n=1 Tax=Natrarchaeobius chitinivorans TaxID=1679083 RepID=A0A3N6MT05_NATCH|nr:DUF411 domain-containing protein [Natrarchaeobius chitinivorans]RQG97916.1 metal-binding protein [Natrarchaeobius chitinivorans]